MSGGGSLFEFPAASFGPRLRIKVKESGELDLVALQVLGLVTVAGFVEVGWVPLFLANIVTEEVTELTGDGSFVTGWGSSVNAANSLVLNDGLVGSVGLPSSALFSGAVPIVPNATQAIDLVIAGQNDVFTAGKINVALWYMTVE